MDPKIDSEYVTVAGLQEQRLINAGKGRGGEFGTKFKAHKQVPKGENLH